MSVEASGTSCSQRVARVCEGAMRQLAPGDQRKAVQTIRQRLRQPVRVALAGRVKAGKSTLVNALVGQKIAPTSVEECTRVVTSYTYGVPERVEIVLRDGSVQTRPLEDGHVPDPLGADVRQVDALRVFLSRDALDGIIIVDTPGVSSAEAQHSTRTEEYLMDRDSRRAAEQADALVFLMSHGARADDAEVLDAFDAMFRGTQASPATAVGVLSRADQIGGGVDEDPLALAAGIAVKQAHALRSRSCTVVPVAGLIAEAAETQTLSETDASALEQLAAEAHRERMLFSQESFVTYDTEVPEDHRHRLVTLIDLFGIRKALGLIDEGVKGPAALEASLRELSGVERLRRVIDENFARRSDALKASGALTALSALAWQPPEQGNAEGLRELRETVEDVRLEPEMRAINEIWAGQAAAAEDVYLPDALKEELSRLLVGRTAAERAGVGPQADPERVAEAAREAVARWRSFANGGAMSDTEERIARVVYRSFERLATEADT